ncbi:hypothetical protein EDD16DRAFT_1492589 [Pisolithus croceorrhizus]|nr:hypothetical protein EV401DRAFT_1880086 [Pisolithus croceorrhizus]KAI6104556.1 hypothetical protein EDD16DRAFT_1492589 [Pisolithus croceorrhizus]KAI6140551.1 hypothetical protein EDD17DRAFT_1499497 [Pisolithus thermaeus]
MLEPKWWNDSSFIHLQLSIVTCGTQPFLSLFPTGPVFTAMYTAVRGHAFSGTSYHPQACDTLVSHACLSSIYVVMDNFM